MEQEKKIDYQQMRAAYDYVESYIKTVGGNPALDFPTEESKIKNWPEDVQKAWEVVDLYWKQNKDRIL